jgi:glutamine cyclotransferase
VKRGPAFVGAILGLLLLGPDPGRLAAAGPPGSAEDAIPAYTFTVVRAYPHDPGAFTEGLVYDRGILIESTGLNGASTLRQVDLASGRVLRQVRLSDEYFGEGAAVLNGRIFQLTWQAHRGFIYDRETLRPAGGFSYDGEGWGLTTDGRSLIMSDGTNRIRFLDPATFQVTRTIDVVAHGRPVTMLNELEYVQGELYANVWQTEYILRIDPQTGRVLGSVDFIGLFPPAETARDQGVMNGIAYDPAGDRLFVTGKNWPTLFEVKLRPK